MDDLSILKIGVIWGGLVLFVALERAFAYAHARNWEHDLKNIAFVVTTAIISKLWILPVSLWAFSFPWHLDLNLPLWGKYFVWFMVLDFWLYVYHRLMHEVPFLWRFHQVHHMDTALDASSALRFHFGELFLSAIFRALPILILGISMEIIVIYETATLFFAIFHHSNWKIPAKFEQWLSKFWITPSLHWLHHHAVQKDTDSNYGVTITLWDKFFGSYNFAKRTPKMNLGIEGKKADLSFINLLKMPFWQR